MIPPWPERSRRSEKGQASLELVGLMPYLLLAALFVWQLLVVAYTATSATNAARSGARAGSLSGGDGRAAAMSSLPSGLRGGATIGGCANGTCSLEVNVPMWFPGLNSPFTVHRTSYFPPPLPGLG